MGDVVDIKDWKIDAGELRNNVYKLDAGLIAPAKEKVVSDIASDHVSEPIKDPNDIMRITRYLTSHGRWRDNMLFVLGINFGLRVSDLRLIRFCDLINTNLTFKDQFPVFEIKTRNTRKRKKNRYITINRAVIEAVTLYLEHMPNVSLSDYLFRSESTNGLCEGRPLTRQSIDKIIKEIAEDVGLNIKVSTHTLRKTFCYHQMVMGGNSERTLLMLQKMLNHSSAAQTLEYIGITRDEIHEAYKNLNLGSEAYSYLAVTNLVEKDSRFA